MMRLSQKLHSICDKKGDPEQLRSVVGERAKWSGGRRAAPSESQPERNDPPPEPQTEARRE